MTRKGPAVLQRYFCSRTRSVRHRVVRQWVRVKKVDVRPQRAKIEAEELFKRA